MSDDDPKDRAREEARAFLSQFLIGMQSLEQSNRVLAQALNQQVQQAQTQIQQSAVLVGQLNLLSSQLDGVAQRLDLLEAQLAYGAALGQQENPQQHLQQRQRPGPSIGQTLGGVLGLSVDRFMGGDGSGGGGRRRR